MPIIYQQNTFYFHCPFTVRLFGQDGEVYNWRYTKRLFGYTSEKHGRLSLNRSIVLRMGATKFAMRTSREDLGECWSKFLSENSPRDAFPALMRLTLDLSDWIPDPGETEALDVQPLIQKFRRPDGLQELTVKVVHDQSNFSDLRELVKGDGHFRIIDKRGKPFSDRLRREDPIEV